VAERHRRIWLQSGYNPANNPAYNRNQTRPNASDPLGEIIIITIIRIYFGVKLDLYDKQSIPHTHL
jgi:hypothetical protein